MGHFGFSYIGLIYMLMLEVPNILWARNKPEGYDPSGENKILLAFERVGQVLCTAAVLLFRDTNPHGWEPWIAWFIASYFPSKWGVPRVVYQDCISNSITTESPLPRWYLLTNNSGMIIGSYGLIVNDFISRQDLWPWLCALYVEESFRGHAFGAKMLEHGRQEAQRLGFGKLYLSTDHIGYYEKYGWRYIGDGYDTDGQPSRIYEIIERELEKLEPLGNENDLIANLEKLHTTELGVLRIKQNLGLTADDVVAWCKGKTALADKIHRRGKNWYVYVDDAVITVNAHSCTIITAHKQK